MDANETKRVETFIRVRQFGADNAADFPAGSVGGTQFAEIDAMRLNRQRATSRRGADSRGRTP